MWLSHHAAVCDSLVGQVELGWVCTKLIPSVSPPQVHMTWHEKVSSCRAPWHQTLGTTSRLLPPCPWVSFSPLHGMGVVTLCWKLDQGDWCQRGQWSGKALGSELAETHGEWLMENMCKISSPVCPASSLQDFLNNVTVEKWTGDFRQLLIHKQVTKFPGMLSNFILSHPSSHEDHLRLSVMWISLLAVEALKGPKRWISDEAPVIVHLFTILFTSFPSPLSNFLLLVSHFTRLCLTTRQQRHGDIGTNGLAIQDGL